MLLLTVVQNCTFTYPGRDKPSLHNVTAAVSLSSRVGIVGPNGAGKVSIRLLLVIFLLILFA